MSVAGLCVVYISGWVWSGEVAEPIGSGVPVRAHHFLLAGLYDMTLSTGWFDEDQRHLGYDAV